MLTFSSFTNEGSREVNEDALGYFSNGPSNCFVVCDGLGGHGMGDTASQTVVSVFKNLFEKSDKASRFLPEAFSAAQEILLTEQIARNARQKMKTTAVALVTDKRHAYIGHIGDSRLYVFHKNCVLKRTLDHSIPQMLVLSHQLGEEEIRNHPDRNIVLRVIIVLFKFAYKVNAVLLRSLFSLVQSNQCIYELRRHLLGLFFCMCNFLIYFRYLWCSLNPQLHFRSLSYPLLFSEDRGVLGRAHYYRPLQ